MFSIYTYYQDALIPIASLFKFLVYIAVVLAQNLDMSAVDLKITPRVLVILNAMEMSGKSLLCILAIVSPPEGDKCCPMQLWRTSRGKVQGQTSSGKHSFVLFFFSRVLLRSG